MDMFAVITILFTLICVVLYIVKTTRKEKKMTFLLAIRLIAFLFFCFVGVMVTMEGTMLEGIQNIIPWLGALSAYSLLALHMTLLFFLCNLKKDVNFKHLVLFFIAGILVSSVIGAFVDVIPSLAHAIDWREFGLSRFWALTENPNRLHMLLFSAISSLFVLDLRKQISKRVFIILFVLLFALGLSTIARTFVVTILLLTAVYLTLKLLRDKKTAIKQILVLGITVLLVCGTVFPYTVASIARTVNIPIPGDHIVTRANPPRHEAHGVDVGNWMWGAGYDDPGRMIIWERYLKDWVSSPRTFFFGRGVDSPAIQQVHAHNIVVWLLNKTGLIGFLLFMWFWLTLFYTMYKVKKYKFCLASFLILLAFLGVGMFELILPRVQGFIYFFMFVFSLEKKEEPAEIPETIPTTTVNTTKETSI